MSKAPANVLDIGRGNGRFLKGLIDKNYSGYGIELPSKSAESASRVPGLNLKTGQLCEDAFEAHFFDAVTMWHVIEHFPEPRKTLQIIGKILKQGGYLMVSLPNIDSFQSRLFKGRWLHLNPRHYKTSYPPIQLLSCVRRSACSLPGCWPHKRCAIYLQENPFFEKRRKTPFFFQKMPYPTTYLNIHKAVYCE